MTLFAVICAERWLITPDGLRQILAVVSREHLNTDLAALLREERAARPSAMALREGRPLDGARYTTVREGVAVVPITGPIFRHANLLTEYSGGTASGLLAQDIQAALDSPVVDALLLTIDSPGGEATGIHELANVIYAGRQKKPVRAYAEGLMASAAYWLGAAAERIDADATAALGSIGAVMAVRDPDKAKAADIEIVSSQSPRKRPDVRTEAGRGQLQQIVDDLAGVFIERIAAYRNTTPEQVAADFGQGGVLIGQAAVDAGLADGLSSFEAVLGAMQAQIRERRQQISTARWSATSERQYDRVGVPPGYTYTITKRR